MNRVITAATFLTPGLHSANRTQGPVFVCSVFRMLEPGP